MRDDLFVMVDPPKGGVLRLRARLQRRPQPRRWRRATVGAAVVVLAAIATLWARTDPARRPAPDTVVAFDPALHPALAVVGDTVLPPVSLRSPSGALQRRSTRDENIVLYELAP